MVMLKYTIQSPFFVSTYHKHAAQNKQKTAFKDFYDCLSHWEFNISFLED